MEVNCSQCTCGVIRMDRWSIEEVRVRVSVREKKNESVNRNVERMSEGS